MAKAKVVLVAFYNIKALGVRYLESALRKADYEVTTVFFKDFNSVNPSPATGEELKLLAQLVKKEQPLFIGYSVMSSMYIETVEKVMAAVRELSPELPSVCGGAFATMFPERYVQEINDFTIRSDGEISICELADSLLKKDGKRDIPSLCYYRNGEVVVNPIGNVLEDIDGYGLPTIECPNAYFIENGNMRQGDPQLSTMSYEVIASRGCPFTCSYCCCENLRRLFPKGMKYVRTRSVESVMAELVEVKKKFKRLVFVHFYDEIFPNLPGWIDTFVREYRAKINLPFTIWSHPKMVRADELKKLASAGLTEVIMGIQSGSEHIRRDVFHRYESQEDIIKATQTIRDSGVFWASYDFMLQHPFESIDDLKETYFLAKKMAMPFELQLHGLNFLPGTDIVQMAIDQGLVTPEKMDAIMYAPMAEQFGAYWKQEKDPLGQLWYRMTYCLQFPALRKKVIAFESNPEAHADAINACYATARKKFQRRYYYKKSGVVLKNVKMKIFRPRKAK